MKAYKKTQLVILDKSVTILENFIVSDDYDWDMSHTTYIVDNKSFNTLEDLIKSLTTKKCIHHSHDPIVYWTDEGNHVVLALLFREGKGQWRCQGIGGERDVYGTFTDCFKKCQGWLKDAGYEV